MLYFSQIHLSVECSDICNTGPVTQHTQFLSSSVSSQTWWNFEAISCPAEPRGVFVCLEVSEQVSSLSLHPSWLAGKYQTQIKTFGEIQPTFVLPHLGCIRTVHCSRIGHYIDLILSAHSPHHTLRLTLLTDIIPFQNQAPPWWKDPLMGPAFPTGEILTANIFSWCQRGWKYETLC